MDAILYVVRTGCSWRQLSADFPPWQTVYWNFVRWEDQDVTQQIMDVLRRRVRGRAGRDPELSAAIIRPAAGEVQRRCAKERNCPLTACSLPCARSPWPR
ncbi:transposase [Nonomuraea glycinis]|uniref:transposase n=1 Tax=Nonomuraea glycinis TaxID=2047744 RepID=UPI003F4B56D8